MSKDLERVIEYAKQRVQHECDNRFNDDHARAIIIEMESIISLCTQLKSEQPQQKDGNECIGMEVRYVGKTDEYFTEGEWYQCVGNYNKPKAFISNNGETDGMHPDNHIDFDLDNPRPIQNK